MNEVPLLLALLAAVASVSYARWVWLRRVDPLLFARVSIRLVGAGNRDRAVKLTWAAQLQAAFEAAFEPRARRMLLVGRAAAAATALAGAAMALATFVPQALLPWALAFGAVGVLVGGWAAYVALRAPGPARATFLTVLPTLVASVVEAKKPPPPPFCVDIYRGDVFVRTDSLSLRVVKIVFPSNTVSVSTACKRVDHLDGRARDSRGGGSHNIWIHTAPAHRVLRMRGGEATSNSFSASTGSAQPVRRRKFRKRWVQPEEDAG